MKHLNVEIIMPAVKETDSGAYILNTKYKKTTGVQELVRCKDCKHMQISDELTHKSGMYCCHPNMDCEQIDGTDDWWLAVEVDGFCKWGERKENE